MNGEQVEVKFNCALNIQNDYMKEIQEYSLGDSIQDKSGGNTLVLLKNENIGCREWARLFMVCD